MVRLVSMASQFFEARNAIKLLQIGIDALKITARRVAYSLTESDLFPFQANQHIRSSAKKTAKAS